VDWQQNVRVVGTLVPTVTGVTFTDENGASVMELDSVVVHSAREETPGATALIVECYYSPQPKEVGILLKKTYIHVYMWRSSRN
jgi:hypothetical protein